MYQFERIKCIIWDLDETFWEGTLSEGKVTVPKEHRELLIRAADIGIISAICSKNDWEPVKAELKQNGLLDYFVFPSVNWEPKGNRVKQLIEAMQLRPVNVLFLDDNPSNREEVCFYCPEIMAEAPEVIPELLTKANAAEKTDPDHRRLKQYRVLEEKNHEKTKFTSNEDFLMNSGIHLEIGHDCMAQLDRIHDLILRANQLNFTKVRSTREELRCLLEDCRTESGCVSVSDKYGDYGIVGFYALQEGSLLHFVFSCRTLGMGIEQYTYNFLNRPRLKIVEPVVSSLAAGELPAWINREGISEKAEKLQIRNLTKHAVLIKGPCDLFQIYPYIAQTEMFDTEFTYTTDRGLTIESTGHTTHIVESERLTSAEKARVLKEVPFTDPGMYNDAVFRNAYRVVIISILADANLGVYRRKGTGEQLAIMEYNHPLTDPTSWPGIISGRYPHAGFTFTEEILRDFAEKYEFVGRNTPEQTVANLRYIREHLPEDCTLAIMLGGELYYEKNTFEAYRDRHIVHQRMNKAIRAFAAETAGVELLDVNKYLTDQSSFYDHFNHYIKPVYYSLAAEIVDLVNRCTGSSIRETSRLKMLQVRLKEALAPTYYRFRKLIGKKR